MERFEPATPNELCSVKLAYLSDEDVQIHTPATPSTEPKCKIMTRSIQTSGASSSELKENRRLNTLRHAIHQHNRRVKKSRISMPSFPPDPSASNQKDPDCPESAACERQYESDGVAATVCGDDRDKLAAEEVHAIFEERKFVRVTVR